MYYGFDIGGTKIEFGAFNSQLEQLVIQRVATPVDDYAQLLERLSELVFKHDELFSCQGYVGIGIPGIEEPHTARLLTANIPCANGKTLARDLEAIIKRPIKIANDANCFVLSEAWDRELRDEVSILGLILGTGVGGGLVFNGHIFAGLNGVAGEIGHMRLPVDALTLLGDNAPHFSCGCGQQGCIENYISGRGFEQLFCHRYAEQKSAIEIINAYQAGAKRECEYVDLFMELLAICLANIFTALDPHLVVLGGGLSNFSLIYEELPKRVPKYLLSLAKPPRIIQAKYGDSGGVRGAAFLHID